MSDESPTRSKCEIYKTLIPQIEFLFEKETDFTANLSNSIAILKHAFSYFFWIGFYIVKEDQLVLGPFQGLPAISRIGYGLGVCGTCWKEKCTQLVPDVNEFAGHIACNSQSQSEIVLPLFAGNEVVAVLDIDGDQKNDFDEVDVCYLEQISAIFSAHWPK